MPLLPLPLQEAPPKVREEMLSQRFGAARAAAEAAAAEAARAAATAFSAMLAEMGVTPSARWAEERVRLERDPRFNAVKREEREKLFRQAQGGAAAMLLLLQFLLLLPLLWRSC